MALSRPERVRSVVLGCTGAPTGHEPPAPLVIRIARWLPRSLLHALFPQALAAMNGPAADPDEGAEDVAIMASTRTPGWVLRAQERAIKGFESSSRVGSITVPTLVLHGDADTVVPLERGEELARLIPGARLVVLPGAGHNYLAGATALANQEVSDFLHASTTGAQR
jgi:pimeloyl-ACP methyl ester carboxylesterase